VLTALVIDADAASRRRVSGLLQLAGWQVHEATGADDALRMAPVLDLDLVVTDLSMADGHGPTLLRQLRHDGSRARFLVVTADPTEHERAESITAGALACLDKPVDAGVLLDFLRGRTTGSATQAALSPMHEVGDLHDDDLDDELMDRLQEIYVHALPGRINAIASGTWAGDTVAVASAAHTLAGTSGQLGHPEVASLCQAIAADARRGVLAHARLVELHQLAAV
jgi:CheY-like chemotaxis protein